MQASKLIQWAIVFVAMMLLAGFYLWMGSVNPYEGNSSDSHYYLILADFFGRGKEVAPGIESYIAQITQFPPGYPFALSIFGGGSDGIERAHLVNSAFYALGFMFFFYWLHINGLNPLASLALTLAVALNHTQLLYSIDILSESQYFLLSALILIFLEKANSKERLLLASTVIGLSILTRSIAIAFLLPLLVQFSRVPSNFFRRGMVFLLALLPALSWKILEKFFLTSPYTQRTGYLDIFNQAHGDASLQAVLSLLTSNLTALIHSWFNFLSGLPPVVNYVVGTVLGFAILTCAVIRLRRLDPLALYLFAYFGIVVCWPFPLSYGTIHGACLSLSPRHAGAGQWQVARREENEISICTDRVTGHHFYACCQRIDPTHVH